MRKSEALLPSPLENTNVCHVTGNFIINWDSKNTHLLSFPHRCRDSAASDQNQCSCERRTLSGNTKNIRCKILNKEILYLYFYNISYILWLFYKLLRFFFHLKRQNIWCAWFDNLTPIGTRAKYLYHIFTVDKCNLTFTNVSTLVRSRRRVIELAASVSLILSQFYLSSRISRLR